jgi:uncharacterized caspase-like protein
MSKRRHWRIVSVGMLTAVSLSGGLPVYAQGQNTGSTSQGSMNASGKSNQGATKTPVKPPQSGMKKEKPSSKSPQRGLKRDADVPQRGVTPVDAMPSSSISVGPYYALVIGINDYAYLGRLKTAVNDATAVAQMLQTQYGFQTKLLKNATRSEIMTALADYRQTLKENSNLLIYYAGHGYNDRDAGEAYWLPVNAKSNNNDNWISADDITRAVRAISSLHVIIIADSCYSGDLTRGAFNIDLGEHGAVLVKRLKSKSRTLMASGGDEPVADNGPGGHSVFAAAVLQALAQTRDPAFTASDLFRRIETPVANRSGQMPQYDLIRNSGHEFGDFIFSRGGARAFTAASTSPGPTSETDADKAAIDELVQSYQQAYGNRDAAALWGIWPGVPAKTKHKIEDSFKIPGSMQMKILPNAPEIAADRQDAVVRTQFSQVFTPENSKPLKEQKGSIVFVLKKSDSRWVIAGVE